LIFFHRKGTLFLLIIYYPEILVNVSRVNNDITGRAGGIGKKYNPAGVTFPQESLRQASPPVSYNALYET